MVKENSNIKLLSSVEMIFQDGIFFESCFKEQNGLKKLLQSDNSRNRSKLKISFEYYLFTIVVKNNIRRKREEREIEREKKERER